MEVVPQGPRNLACGVLSVPEFERGPDTGLEAFNDAGGYTVIDIFLYAGSFQVSSVQFFCAENGRGLLPLSLVSGLLCRFAQNDAPGFLGHVLQIDVEALAVLGDLK